MQLFITALEVIGLIHFKRRIVTGDALHCNRQTAPAPGLRYSPTPCARPASFPTFITGRRRLPRGCIATVGSSRPFSQ